jgi:hypothetical protein
VQLSCVVCRVSVGIYMKNRKYCQPPDCRTSTHVKFWRSVVFSTGPSSEKRPWTTATTHNRHHRYHINTYIYINYLYITLFHCATQNSITFGTLRVIPRRRTTSSSTTVVVPVRSPTHSTNTLTVHTHIRIVFSSCSTLIC